MKISFHVPGEGRRSLTFDHATPGTRVLGLRVIGTSEGGRETVARFRAERAEQRAREARSTARSARASDFVRDASPKTAKPTARRSTRLSESEPKPTSDLAKLGAKTGVFEYTGDAFAATTRKQADANDHGA